MKMSISSSCLVGLLFLVTSALAQSRPAALSAESVAREMDHWRRGEYPGKGPTDQELRAQDPQQVLALLAPYLKDPSSTVRMTARSHLRRLAELHPTPVIRQAVLESLLDLCLRRPAEVGQDLRIFQCEEDFSPTTKQMIRQAMADRHKYYLVIRLCGVAQLQDQLPRLGELLVEKENGIPGGHLGSVDRNSSAWVARLARARMGVAEDIQRCIAMVDAEPNNYIRLDYFLDDIAYIRRPEAILYLKTYLDSDEALPGGPGTFEPPTPPMPYAHKALDLLTRCLEGFPVERTSSQYYTPQEVQKARK